MSNNDKIDVAVMMGSKSDLETMRPAAKICQRLGLAVEVRASGSTLLLCGAREQPALLMAQASFAQHVGEENICPHVSAAIERARAVHAQDLAREVLI